MDTAVSKWTPHSRVALDVASSIRGGRIAAVVHTLSASHWQHNGRCDMEENQGERLIVTKLGDLKTKDLTTPTGHFCLEFVTFVPQQSYQEVHGRGLLKTSPDYASASRKLGSV